VSFAERKQSSRVPWSKSQTVALPFLLCSYALVHIEAFLNSFMEVKFKVSKRRKVEAPIQAFTEPDVAPDKELRIDKADRVKHLQVQYLSLLRVFPFEEEHLP
jgi:hypothetical protein